MATGSPSSSTTSENGSHDRIPVEAVHKAAEKLFVDFCGKKMGYVDRNSGEVVPVEVFIGILPCSQYTFVKAVPSQNRENTISCMRDCLAYFEWCTACHRFRQPAPW